MAGDNRKIPEQVQINYNNTNYRIYFSLDSLTCFLGKKEGHQAKLCPERITNPEPTDNPVKPLLITLAPNTPTNNRAAKAIIRIPEPKDAHTLQTNSQTYTNNNKRSYPESSTTSDSITDKNMHEAKNIGTQESKFKESIEQPKNKHSNKKTKKAMDTMTEKNKDLLEPIRKIMESEPNKYKYSFLQLKNFIHSTYGCSNISSLVTESTNNGVGFAAKLREFYPHLEARRMKNRFSRIINQIENNSYEDRLLSSSSSMSDLSENNLPYQNKL